MQWHCVAGVTLKIGIHCYYKILLLHPVLIPSYCMNWQKKSQPRFDGVFGGVGVFLVSEEERDKYASESTVR